MWSRLTQTAILNLSVVFQYEYEDEEHFSVLFFSHMKMRNSMGDISSLFWKFSLLWILLNLCELFFSHMKMRNSMGDIPSLFWKFSLLWILLNLCELFFSHMKMRNSMGDIPSLFWKFSLIDIININLCCFSVIWRWGTVRELWTCGFISQRLWLRPWRPGERGQQCITWKQTQNITNGTTTVGSLVQHLRINCRVCPK